jgi:pimeloyl-ACP methyl ester carboxylesterase
MNYSFSGTPKSAGAGRRPPIVAVHGFGGNCHHWRKLSADLCDEYPVYALDLVGFGASEKPSSLTYGPNLWYQQVADFVREVVQEPCVLVGNSIGSQVAMYVASEQPEWVKGVCLLNCVGGMNQRGLYKDSLQVAMMRPVFELLEYLLKKRNIAAWLFNKFSDRDRVEQLLRARGTPYANPDAVHSELVDIFVEPSLDTGAVDVFVGVFTGDPGPRPEKMLEKIDCPVLVAWGDADPWTPLNGSVGRFFQQQAKERDNVDLVALPDTGHSPQDDRPELVAAALCPWLLDI